MLDFIYLSATGVAEIAESTHLKGCPHTFVYIVYVDTDLVREMIKMRLKVKQLPFKHCHDCRQPDKLRVFPKQARRENVRYVHCQTMCRY